MRRVVGRIVLALAGVAVALPVNAHLVETGFGEFYDGIAHVAVTPSDLLVVVALALLAGQRGIVAARYAVFALPIAWFVGGFIGARWPALAAMPLLTTLTFGVAGALVALNFKLRQLGVAALAIGAGVVHGLVNGATMAPAGASSLALGGVVSAIFCVTAILSAEVCALPKGWPQIVVRVAGSWIAAAGLLMIGWLSVS
ncbi:HupE/UreJ family protein [Dechloromonas denitrificans]|uniref:HupE/UreJ family protein n=1 Tax=Dechloromonas denitrificans TaxID=281362 RepID=UPI001CF8D56E|nr:HupE/UreJ family protein [Dechloromonas denitrificans]UCV03238.1 HupE/UreJ family protein [Dechloromonas denitrificans]